MSGTNFGAASQMGGLLNRACTQATARIEGDLSPEVLATTVPRVVAAAQEGWGIKRRVIQKSWLAKVEVERSDGSAARLRSFCQLRLMPAGSALAAEQIRPVGIEECFES